MAIRVKIFDEFRNYLKQRNDEFKSGYTFENEVNEWLECIQKDENLLVEIKDFKYFIAHGENPQLICIYDIKGA